MENNAILESLQNHSPGKIAMVIGIWIMLILTGIGKIKKIFTKEAHV